VVHRFLRRPDFCVTHGSISDYNILRSTAEEPCRASRIRRKSSFPSPGPPACGRPCSTCCPWPGTPPCPPAMRCPTRGTLPGDDRRRGSMQPGHHAERAQDGSQDGTAATHPGRAQTGVLLDQAIGDRTEGPVFLSPLGRGWRVENLSRTYSRLRDLAGLPKDLVLYLARHECGTKICREKGIEYARRLLGHTNISTTQRYMHLDDGELADAQDLID